MSEQERETELVLGVIEGVTLKREGTWQVAVKPDGSQYTKNLWTKSEETVRALEKLLGEHRAFACNVSYWENKSGQQVRSLWLEHVSEDGEAPAAVPKPGGLPAPATSSLTMSKEDWARKDSAIHKMACIKTAADALKHTVPSDPSSADLNKFIERVAVLSVSWHRAVLAERDDPTGEEIPF
jgi:hypothetical protein